MAAQGLAAGHLPAVLLRHDGTTEPLPGHQGVRVSANAPGADVTGATELLRGLRELTRGGADPVLVMRVLQARRGSGSWLLLSLLGSWLPAGAAAARLGCGWAAAPMLRPCARAVSMRFRCVPVDRRASCPHPPTPAPQRGGETVLALGASGDGHHGALLATTAQELLAASKDALNQRAVERRLAAGASGSRRSGRLAAAASSKREADGGGGGKRKADGGGAGGGGKRKRT